MGAIFLQLIKLLVIDVVFIGLLALVLAPVAMYNKASFALVKRNVLGYFSNPTGYVFLCLFVLLTSAFAFWTDKFFTANLANLDELSRYMPLILLLFIPAITMSIWSEERRQGTDELLLTLPATDAEIVWGKYLAAAVIFTFSLLFAQISTFTVLTLLSLGDLDVGLIFTTYIGYWLMGLAMLALGMVASFLTNNMTVSFVLGMLLNSLLVAIAWMDHAISAPAIANTAMQWSLWSQFDDFGRGVLSLASILYFVSILSIGIYISVILIGRRHWSGRGRDQTQNELTTLTIGVSLGLLVLGLICFLGTTLTSHPRFLLALQWSGGALLILSLLTINASAIINAMQGGMLGHFMLRVECLVIAALGLCFYLSRHEVIRQDMTQGSVSSLSPDTIKLLRELDAKRPVTIDAFISADMPKDFIRTRYNLVSSLKELASYSGGKIKVKMHDNLEMFSEEAALAETRFGIKKQTVQLQNREKMSQEELILGAAFTCGLEKVVVPFFGHGLPVEYELIRSIATVAKGERKKLGVVTTDAQMYGGFSMQGMQPRQIPKQAIIDELEKQYRVEQVDPTSPIEVGKYDALLIVQPSSLGPQELANVVDVIRQGQPAAIFEDPMPSIFAGGSLVGTSMDKPPQGGFMGMGGGPPPPKGDIRALWEVLGIKPIGDAGPAGPVPGNIVWQAYNPYPRFTRTGLGPELVFVREEAPGANNVFNRDSKMVAGMEELLLLIPGGIEEAIGAKTKFTRLVTTASRATGTIDSQKLRGIQGNRRLLEKEYEDTQSDRTYTLAAEIIGPEITTPEVNPTAAKKDDDKKGEEKSDEEKKKRHIHVVYVADVDMLDGFFLQNRNMPNAMFNFRFDNVVFALNAIDAAASDERFLRIRIRKPQHSTLRMIEEKVSRTRDEETNALKKYQDQFDKSVAELEAEKEKDLAEFNKELDELRKQQAEGKLDAAKVADFREKERQKQIQEAIINQRIEVRKKQLEQELERAGDKLRRNGDRDIESTQNSIKIAATVLPLIFPLLIGLSVYAQRRVREREGVSKARLRY
jgi:ABC-2 type transport system permease protein